MLQKFRELWENISERGSKKKDVFIHLRRIHASWMLWLVAVVFTVIISPYMFLIYQIPYVVIAISVVICVSTLGGNKLGSKIIDRFFLEEVRQKHDLGAQVLWIARLSLIIFPVILLMDIASVAAESYYNGMITQYYVYWASVILLIIMTFMLAGSLPRFRLRKRNEEV